MNSSTDQQLLRDHTERKHDAAFAELVRRHIDFVYSAALRMVRDPHLAEDVTQAVFMALAKNAHQLVACSALEGWLHGTTRNLAANVVRAEVRRRNREQEAATMNEILSAGTDANWEQIAPHLDEALGELTGSERDALLLRYVKNLDFRTVGLALGVSDDTAQKRVSRAIERLREFLHRRGVTVGANGLVVVISANAVQAAPAGLAVTISTAAFSGTAVATSTIIAKTAHTIAMTALQKSLIAVVAVVGVATPLVLHQRSVDRQSAVNAELQSQSTKLAQQQAENERLAGLAGKAAQPAEQSTELIRLRAQAKSLQNTSNSLAKLKAENRKLRAAADMPEVEPSDAEKQEMQARLVENKTWLMTSYLYARNNQGRFPTGLSALAKDPRAPGGGSSADQYDVVYQGTIADLSKPQNVIVLKQKEPMPYGNRWAKTYGYADGHVEIHVQADSDFKDWENQHLTNSTARKQ